MSEIISRGKLQILFNNLPGRTFDFKKGVLAKAEKVRGQHFQQLNHSLLVRKVSEHARAWHEDYRPLLRNEILSDDSRFVIVNPAHVSCILFPLVFWCSDNNCKRIFNYTSDSRIPSSRTCPSCHRGKLRQLQFVKVHQCGNLEPLFPWSCRNCGSNNIALDDRGSTVERIALMRWRCLDCQSTSPIFGGRCSRCSWPNGNNSQQMSVEHFRSNKIFYVHTATLLNIPEREYDVLFSQNEWYVISTAKYLGLEALRNTQIKEYASRVGNSGQQSGSVSGANLEDLFSQRNSGKLTDEEFISRIEQLRNAANPSLEDLKTTIRSTSGIDAELWDEAKYDVIDSIIPFEIGAVTELDNEDAANHATSLGISQLVLIDDFPIIIASYGFSRVEARPYSADGTPLCYLNPFPGDREQGGRYPVFVDKVQADALFFQLDPFKVINWLRVNGYEVNLPVGNNQDCVAKGYFINLFNDINIHEKIFRDQPIARLVLGLIHTYSHLAIKHASLLCGLEKTSIAEYVVPKTLSVALYCNHRFGATIGALTALFEQSVIEWLNQIENERRCIYDPVCHEKGGNCHSCTHLAETSCKLFNQNLSRSYLFGGYDPELDRDIVGYFNPIVQTT